MLARVEYAITRLRNGDLATQVRACDTLASLGFAASPAAPAMVEALQTGEFYLVEKLKVAFRAIGAPAVPALLDGLRSDAIELRRRTAQALCLIGPAAADAADELAACLSDQDTALAEIAANALRDIGIGALPAVLRALGHYEPKVRSAAAGLLMFIHSQESVPALTKALDDPNEIVRTRAQAALRFVPDGDTEAIIEKCLRELESSRSIAQTLACEALADLGPDAAPAIPALLSALDETDAYVHGAACVAFRAIGKPAVPSLLKALEFTDIRRRLPSEVNTKCRIAMALQFIGRQAADAAEPLAAWLRHNDERLELAAGGALCAIGPMALPPLLKVLQDGDEDTRVRAIAVLESLPSFNAEATIAKAAREDSNKKVRARAAAALENRAARTSRTLAE